MTDKLSSKHQNLLENFSQIVWGDGHWMWVFQRYTYTDGTHDTQRIYNKRSTLNIKQ